MSASGGSTEGLYSIFPSHTIYKTDGIDARADDDHNR